MLVPLALRLHGPRAVNRFGDLSPGHTAGYVVGKSGVCVGIADAVGYRHKPTWAGDSAAISRAAVSKSTNGLAMLFIA